MTRENTQAVKTADSGDTAWGEFGLPESEVAREALRYTRGIETPAMFHHSIRTYLYGRCVGERRGVVPGRDYDDELLFLGCVLHDLGLTEEGNGEQRFEVDGADLAAEFLTRQGVPSERVEVVWDAIALHTSEGIASRKRPEIALVSAGARTDIAGHAGQLPPGYADRVHAALPRLHAAAVLHDVIVAQALAEPRKAPPFSLPGELLMLRTEAPRPTWKQITQSPGWNDYAGYEG
ncbi:HD domain-containing protein [Streptomyces spectabilis]|uniref:HD domain-containing protein n=1 Tax=Streptomyces spectabilis TaxID=68270 RepID=A0A5P2XM95_STRST|nr:HD domain-containing protein [Streptomyces spectabilis]MBB5102319.1 hypothetical protein [Streptomyces spectabilis]MCI3907367.1 HD domain-containing protein [Streptomyces spectabilis]QEV64090.1 HD domain-containing protein [Streptomyces spectabilis]GGV30082.1 hypothetical protein GCM10010245_48930 [Streptomyces spectabilis]